VLRSELTEIRARVGFAASGFVNAATAATIPPVDRASPDKHQDGSAARIDEEMEESRLLMMRREKQMTADERLAVFEQLARFASWARSAQRVR
jgi:hypothetical protein